MKHEQARAATVALKGLLGRDSFIMTQAASNDMRPRVTSTDCRLTMAEPLRNTQDDWRIGFVFKDSAQNAAFEIEQIFHVEAWATEWTVFIWTKTDQGTTYCIGMRPSMTGGKNGLSSWQEVSDMLRRHFGEMNGS